MCLPVYEYAEQIDRRIGALLPRDLIRKSRVAKRLLEELYPLGRLALQFKRPDVDVQVEAYENSGAADGKITLSGPYERVFEIQVTFVDSAEEALRRELLWKQGWTPGAGAIARKRNSREIEAEVGFQDVDQPIKDLGQSIVDLAEKKRDRDYGPDAILLVAFNDGFLQGWDAWQAIVSEVRTRGGVQLGCFDSVYLLNTASNELHRVA
jgi:hypothetical protein